MDAGAGIAAIARWHDTSEASTNATEQIGVHEHVGKGGVEAKAYRADVMGKLRILFIG